MTIPALPTVKSGILRDRTPHAAVAPSVGQPERVSSFMAAEGVPPLTLAVGVELDLKLVASSGA